MSRGYDERWGVGRCMERRGDGEREEREGGNGRSRGRRGKEGMEGVGGGEGRRDWKG